MSRDDHDHTDDIEELPGIDDQLFLHHRIFEGDWMNADLSQFDDVTIQLDGRVQSDLLWKSERDQAQKAIENGFGIMWEMQMGLFDEMPQPIANQTQFLSLTLALEHFRDSLWKEFKQHSVGFVLYRGSADFARNFPWDDNQQANFRAWLLEKGLSELIEQEFHQLIQCHEGRLWARLFCRDVIVEYLYLLTSRIPDSLPVFLYLDVSPVSRSLSAELQLLNPERFDRFQVALKNTHLTYNAFGWNVPSPYGYIGNVAIQKLPEMPELSIGVCIPPLNNYQTHSYLELENAIKELQTRSLPFKLIGENYLTSQWDGLDYLLFAQSGMSAQGMRKLLGFCAAGGIPVSTGEKVGLPGEMDFMEFIKLFS